MEWSKVLIQFLNENGMEVGNATVGWCQPPEHKLLNPDHLFSFSNNNKKIIQVPYT